MFFLLRPSSIATEQFLRRSRELPLTYGPIGIAQDPAAGRNYDDTVVIIGRGEQDFERARAALAAWRQFEMDWVTLIPRDASLEPGAVVSVLVRHLGFWSLNGARVVYGVGDRHHGDRFGLAYGTLANHAERGEEIFEVSIERQSGDVTYRIRAASWPRALLARIGYPIARLFQAKFRRDSVAAMKRAISIATPPPDRSAMLATPDRQSRSQPSLPAPP